MKQKTPKRGGRATVVKNEIKKTHNLQELVSPRQTLIHDDVPPVDNIRTQYEV